MIKTWRIEKVYVQKGEPTVSPHPYNGSVFNCRMIPDSNDAMAVHFDRDLNFICIMRRGELFEPSRKQRERILDAAIGAIAMHNLVGDTEGFPEQEFDL